MAKKKFFAVDIEYTTRETIYVTARRPNGAAERALTDEAHHYCSSDECCDCCSRNLSLPKGAKVVEVRQV